MPCDFICRRNESLHLRRRTRNQDGKIAFLHFPVFLVGAAVVGQAVVVERFAQGIAPMTVVRSDGGGKSVRFRFADKSGSVGVHDVL